MDIVIGSRSWSIKSFDVPKVMNIDLYVYEGPVIYKKVVLDWYMTHES